MCVSDAFGKPLWAHGSNCGGTGTEAGVKNSLLHYKDTDSTFARCFKGAGYERCIGDILGYLRATPFSKWLWELADLIGFDRSFGRIYLVANWRY